jgi:hypothetical protein
MGYIKFLFNYMYNILLFIMNLKIYYIIRKIVLNYIFHLFPNMEIRKNETSQISFMHM